MSRGRDPRWLPAAAVATVAAALAFAVVYGTLALLRLDAFQTRSYDLALYDRTIWGIAHGDWHNPLRGRHVLAMHFEPILLAFAPLWRWSPALPLVAQTLSLAAAAIPVYALGARRTGSPWAGAALALAFLLHPALGHTAVFDFHPVALAVAPLAGALWALEAGRQRLAGALLLGAIACREDLAPVVACLGLTLLVRPERRRLGGALAALGIGWYAAWALAVVPLAGVPAGPDPDAHFGYLGSGLGDIVRALIADPGRVADHVDLARKAVFGLLLVAPFAGAPLLAPARLVPALPLCAALALSAFPATSRFADSHYAVALVPFLADAAAAALARPWLPRRAALPAVALASLAVHVGHGAGPGSRGFRADSFVHGPTAVIGRKAISEIPPEAAVSAPIGWAPHLSHRKRVHIVPLGIDRADVVVLDFAAPPTIAFGSNGEWRRHLGRIWRSLRAGREFDVKGYSPEVFVFLRRPPRARR